MRQGLRRDFVGAAIVEIWPSIAAPPSMKEGRKTALLGRSPLEGGIVIENRAVLPAGEDR